MGGGFATRAIIGMREALIATKPAPSEASCPLGAKRRLRVTLGRQTHPLVGKGPDAGCG